MVPIELHTEWRKSSFSGPDSNCVEIARQKSTFSAEDSNCVEVAHAGEAAAVCDSKSPTGPYLVLSADAYRELIAWRR